MSIGKSIQFTSPRHALGGARLRFGLSTAIVIVFSVLIVLGVKASSSPPQAGVLVGWSQARQDWIVKSVEPPSIAYDAGVRNGDLVVSLGQQQKTLPATGSVSTMDAGSSVVVVNAQTGQEILVNARSQEPDWSFILLCSFVFVIVGIAVLSVGSGSAPRALALICLTGGLELAVLPSFSRLHSWSYPIHAELLPLAFASFTYLFLVFPIKRNIRVGRVTVPAWTVLLTSIPFAGLWYYAVQIHSSIYNTFRVWGFRYFLVYLLVGIGVLIYGWRTTSGRRARTQIRIVVVSSLVSVLPFMLLSALTEVVFGRYFIPPQDAVLSLVLIPLSFAYAILRYQIMDLQLYLRRGIVYSVLALVVTGIYALILFLGTTVVQHQLGMNDVFVLAVSGTVVAIIFQRLRDELQRLVDRAFDRGHYDYRTQLLEFSRRMTEHLAGEDLGRLTATLVSQTLEPTHVRMYMFIPDVQMFRLTAGVGIPAPQSLFEINPRNPLVDNLDEDGGFRQRFDAAADEAALVTLLKKEEDVVGLLVLGPKKADLPYTSDDMSLLKTVANQLAVAADNSRLYERTRDLYLSSIRTLAATVDAKDPYTHGHSERVAAYSRSIADALNLKREDVESIELAGLLHDIGKIGIPDSVLQKPGRLDPDERELIMEHAALGAKIISENPSLMPLAPLVRHHHEWYNGGGYPDGLEGVEIPLGAAIISVADTFDTMTTDRPYRAAPGREKALAELGRCSGTQFHPDVVSTFLKLQGYSAPSHCVQEVGQHTYTVTGRISTVDTRAMRIVYRVVQMIGEVTELDSFIARVVDLIQRELGTGTVDIYLTDLLSGDLVSQTAPTMEEAVKATIVESGKGLVGWVADHCVPARIENTQHDTRGNQGRHPKTRSHLAVPLVIDGQTIGVIDVQSRRTGAFTPDDETLLVIVAQQLAQVVEVAQLHDQLKKNAALDGLTGVSNHRHFYQRLEEELARAERIGGDVSVLLIDVDGLKLLNDTHGHIAGDAALRALAVLLERESRVSDIVARYGGDEFAIILPGVDEAGAVQYARRIVGVMNDSTFELHGEIVALPSISWGMASFAKDGGRAVSLVAAADARMYRNKFESAKSQPREVAASGRD